MYILSQKVLQQTLEESGIKLEDFAKTSPLVSAQFHEALATKTDLIDSRYRICDSDCRPNIRPTDYSAPQDRSSRHEPDRGARVHPYSRAKTSNPKWKDC
jgi:hypothetical protein